MPRASTSPARMPSDAIGPAPVLLVHGAWSGGWVWWAVRRHLRRHGIRSHVVDLPSQRHLDASLEDDAAAVSAGLARLGEPAVVVAHSYGGVPVAQAGADEPSARHLVYVAAIVPRPGESTLELMARDPAPSPWSRFLQTTRTGRALMDFPRLRTRARGRRPDPRERTFVLAAAPDRVAGAGVPSTYVVLTRDLILSAALQRWMAHRAGAGTIAVPALHIGIVTHARRIADIVAAIARACPSDADAVPVPAAGIAAT